MSEDPTPQADADSPQQKSETPRVDKKPRSPMERIVVWGGIIVLLLLVGFQAHARYGYELTLNRLQPLIDDDFEGSEPLRITEVGGHVVGFPSESETQVTRTRTDRVYRWQGLRGSYGITLAYNPLGDPPIVSSLVTDGAPVPEAPVYADTGEDGEFDEEMLMPDPGGMTPGGGGPGGGGGGFNPMDNDADGDGKLSPDEVPERMLERFDENDIDGSGFLEESELESMRERLRQENGAGAGEDRPQRPSLEGADEPAPEDATPDDEPASAESGEEETAESP